MIDTFQAKFNNGWLGAIIFWISSAVIGIIMCLIILAYSSHQAKKTQLATADVKSEEQETVKQ